MFPSIRKEENMINLEDTMLSEINQTKEDEWCVISVMWSKVQLINLWVSGEARGG